MSEPASGLQRRAYNVGAMRTLAMRALPKPVFDFADGGAEDEVTLRRNEAAFDEVELLPRPLEGAATRDLSIDLFGHKLKLPVVIGPTGLAGLFWPNGERESARAAQAAGAAYCLSHGSVCTLEQLAETGVSPRWMQVFVYNDAAFTRELVDRAAAAKFDALVLTVDNQFLGNRERDVRNGFGIPPRFKPADLAGMALRLPWLARMRQELPRITFGNYVRPGQANDIATLAGRMAHLLDPGLNWRDVDAIRAQWKGPLILKGIMHPAEAAEAVARGVDGIVVSNHGGRQLDGAAPTIAALPGVVDAVAGRATVLLDGGVRRGVDVVRAIALGASACLIGRPQLWGLSVAGQAGVSLVLEIYRREIDRTMGLLGARRLADLGPDLLFRAGNRAGAPVY